MKHILPGASAALFGALLVATPLLSGPALAQSDTNSTAHGFWVTASHPDIAIAPGKAASFPLRLRNDTDAPQRATLTVKDLPKGWTYTLKAGGTQVSSSMILPDDTDDMTLNVVPAAGASNNTYKFEVDAKSATQDQSLPLTVQIANITAGKTTLTPELPALRGTTSTSFQYKLKLTNGGTKDALFNLSAEVPDGFQTTFKHGYGSEEITGLPVKAGQTEDITLQVKPNDLVAAGDYPIKVSAVAGPDAPSAETEVKLEVTGQPSLSLTSPDQRLSGTATAGKETTFPFTVRNTGSAPADHVKLTASAPTGWKVSFEPKEIDELQPNATQDVSVKVTPSDKAIAGDYMINFNTRAKDASDSTRFRVTVETSTMWGIIGVVIIAIAVLILVGAVFRYGRR